MYRIDGDVLEMDDLKYFVEDFKRKRSRYEALQKYWEGDVQIYENFERDIQKEIKAFNPYPKYITNMLTGYFLGKPVRYAAVDQKTTTDEELLEALVDIYRYNDEQANNFELAKTASVKGSAVEILWADEDANIRFKGLEPEEAFGIYDSSLEENLLFGVRLYSNRENFMDVEYVEVSDRSHTWTYRVSDNYRLIEEREHFFGDVPFVFYKNNKEEKGDWEDLISLIEAYNLVQTNTLKDMEEFTDSFLVLVNMSGTTEEDLRRARETKTLLHESDGDAKWLIKDVNDTWVENYKNRLNHDIHKFSFTPDLTDENFGSNLSGVSLRYKLLGMEQLRAGKERLFKKGLMRRIELICNYLKYIDREYDFMGIDIKFNNTLPQNILEITQVMQNLQPLLSKETLISMLPDVENAKEEMERKEAEEDYTEDYSALETLVSPGEDDEE